jgi:hypothetical protein
MEEMINSGITWSIRPTLKGWELTSDKNLSGHKTTEDDKWLRGTSPDLKFIFTIIEKLEKLSMEQQAKNVTS